MSDQLDSVLTAVGERSSPLSQILDDVRQFIKRFCVFPNEHCFTAVTLWATHTHIIENLWTTPRLAILSPELESGKTRVLDVLNLLVQEPFFSINPTPATVFRMLAVKQITLLFDECDTVFKKYGKDDTHEDLRALLNSGYRKGATVPRCVQPKWEVECFDVFCPVAMASIGELPPTIMSRSIVIQIKRRTKAEKIDQFRYRYESVEGHALRDRLEQWATKVGSEAREMVPEMPDGIVDRASEVWEPLLTVAELAKGHWPKLASDACMHLCKRGVEGRDSLGVRLLSDLKKIFGNEDKLRTSEILERLTTDAERRNEKGDLEPLLDDDAPWAIINHGKPLDGRTLAGFLRSYGVKATKIRKKGDKPFQGYYADELSDAQSRYATTSESAEQAEQAEHTSNVATIVPDVPDVPDLQGKERENETRPSNDVGELKI